MKIKFLGAVGEVTGSCTWCILDSGVQFLVDCGMFQGWGAEFKNPEKFPFDADKIKFVLLTHAHMDHCGRIPLLYKRGFRGKVYCTEATKALTILNLQDAAKNMEKYEDMDSLYAPWDVKEIKFSAFNEHETGFGKPVRLSVEDSFVVYFTRSSHMLGAVSISVSWRTRDGALKRAFFSGDVGNNRIGCCYQPTLKKHHVPHETVDYVVLESTYGAKPEREPQFQDAEERMKAILNIVNDPRYSTFIFPCFAMQRTQDVLLDLYCALQYRNNDGNVKYKIVLDSPMARKACKIFSRHLTAVNSANPEKSIYLNREHFEKFAFGADALFLVKEVLYDGARAGQLLEDDGADKTIFITSSGMCHEGPVLNHLEKLTRPDTALVLTGYQSTDNGQCLQKCADGEKKEDSFLEANDEKIAVSKIRGGVFNLGAYYSGHADTANLLRFLFEQSEVPRKSESPKSVRVFLNHGDGAARLKFKELIKSRPPRADDMRAVEEVIIPAPGDGFYDLNKGDWAGAEYQAALDRQRIMDKLDSLLALMSVNKKSKGKKHKQPGGKNHAAPGNAAAQAEKPHETKSVAFPHEPPKQIGDTEVLTKKTRKILPPPK